SYHSPVKRSTLGTPAPAFTAAEMKERTREYQEKSQFMLEGPPIMPAAQAEMRPGTRGSDRTRTASRQSGRGSVGGRDSVIGFQGQEPAHTSSPAPARSISPRPQSYQEQQQQQQPQEQSQASYDQRSSPQPPQTPSSGYRASPTPTAPLNFQSPSPSMKPEPQEPIKQSPTEYRTSPAPTMNDERGAQTPTPAQPDY